MKRVVAIILFSFNIVISAELTVMIYIGADNELHHQAQEDLKELARVGGSGYVNLLVQLDDRGPSTRRYFVEPGQAVLLEELPELDMADPNTLVNFVRFCVDAYPAKRYSLILWDHGNGWRKELGPGGPQPAIIYDESSGRAMGVAGGDLRSALKRIRNMLGRPLDLLGFDACSMGMIEVAWEVKDFVQVMVGSQSPTPWEGWNYDQILSRLKSDPLASTQTIASRVVESYIGSYQDKGVPCTISALDLSNLSRVEAGLNELCRSLVGRLGRTRLKDVRELVQTFPAGPDSLPRTEDEYVDLIDWLDRLGDISDRVEQDLAGSVIASGRVGTGFAGAKGLTIWFPYHYLGLKHNFREYELLKFAEDVEWLGFLNEYYGQDDLPPSQPILTRADLKGNSYRLYWTTASDLSGVSYELKELQGVSTLLQDGAETAHNWELSGFERSREHPHTGDYSFFSGRGPNLNNWMSLKEPITLPQGGLLSFWCNYQTEESYDWSSGELKRDILYLELSDDGRTWLSVDSLYGRSDGWQEFRYFLPATTLLYLRFRYQTDATDDLAGAYIDDLTIRGFEELRGVVEHHPDTSFHFYQKPHGQYAYGVVAKDESGNQSPVSNLLSVVVKDYAPPYSIPSPFYEGCQVYCDHPEEIEPRVRIYTLTGELVCEFPEGAVKHHRLAWDGKNRAGKEVAAGVYLVEVAGEGFNRIGKIVKVR